MCDRVELQSAHTRFWLPSSCRALHPLSVGCARVAWAYIWRATLWRAHKCAEGNAHAHIERVAAALCVPRAITSVQNGCEAHWNSARHKESICRSRAEHAPNEFTKHTPEIIWALAERRMQIMRVLERERKRLGSALNPNFWSAWSRARRQNAVEANLEAERERGTLM
jgi:hypothetical protein